jgi:hypothetical protein
MDGESQQSATRDASAMLEQQEDSSKGEPASIVKNSSMKKRNKRRRRAVSKKDRAVGRTERGQIPSLDETEFRLNIPEQKTRPYVVGKKRKRMEGPSRSLLPWLKSLPMLLHQRAVGRIKNRQAMHGWQCRMLLTTVQKNRGGDADQSDEGDGEEISNDEKKKDQRIAFKWRPFCLRRVRFTALRVPPTDAVLALDPTGSFIICLGGEIDQRLNNGQNREPSLALRFYGKWRLGIVAYCTPLVRLKHLLN